MVAMDGQDADFAGLQVTVGFPNGTESAAVTIRSRLYFAYYTEG